MSFLQYFVVKVLVPAAAVAIVFGARWLYWARTEAEKLRPHVLPGRGLIKSKCTSRNGSDTPPPCSASSGLQDLETRGFAVLPRFLSESEVQSIRDLYFSKGWAENVNYATKMVDEAELAAEIREKLLRASQQISSVTDIRVDMPLPRSLFFIVNASDEQHSFGIPWHQDTESFFLAESHYNYVNLYMAVEKETVQDGNLQIIPQDVLQNCSPELHRLSRGQGATDFFDCNGSTPRACQEHFGKGQSMSDAGAEMLPPNAAMLRLDNNHAAVHGLGFHLNSLACTPELLPGDLLAFRGDTIHKTGAFSGPRLAWSVRVVWSQDTVSIDRLLSGGIHKLVTINQNIASYTTRMGVIRASGQRELSFAELQKRRSLPSLELAARLLSLLGCLVHAAFPTSLDEV